MDLICMFDEVVYVRGSRIGDVDPTSGRTPRLVNVGDVVFYTSPTPDVGIGRVSRKENPRLCRNCWDFYIEGEGDKVFTRDDLWFANPLPEEAP